ncbi:MAG TPA: hypothetical protein VJV78_29740 [Polyangiales bacterium]|nr:hypothetical protein [Polyangiales bacterium]
MTGWRNIALVAWQGRPTGPATRQLASITDHLLGQLDAGTKLSYIHLVPVGLGLPDADGRAALHEITQKHGQNTACVGVVVSGGGFWASAVRGIVTSVQVIAPRSVEMRIHAKSVELFSWFPKEHEQRTGVSIPWSELTEPIDQAEAWQRASMLAHTG